jgi:hypothetical protein
VTIEQSCIVRWACGCEYTAVPGAEIPRGCPEHWAGSSKFFKVQRFAVPEPGETLDVADGSPA